MCPRLYIRLGINFPYKLDSFSGRVELQTLDSIDYEVKGSLNQSWGKDIQIKKL